MKPMTNIEKNWLSEMNALKVEVRWMNVILEVFVDDEVMIQLPYASQIPIKVGDGEHIVPAGLG